MKFNPFEIIPRTFRRRGCFVALSIFLRALLNFAGLAVLLPVLLLILDTDNIAAHPLLSRLYAAGGFRDGQHFAAAVAAGVVGIVLAKSLLSLALYKIERTYIYDLYRHLSQRLYLAYRNRGLGFIKQSNSALLARNVNIVCLTFVTGILKPVASIAGEVLLFGLLFGALAWYSLRAALLVAVIFLPSVWLYYALVRTRLNRCGEQENRAQRTKTRTVVESFRGYADVEINNAFPRMLETFDRTMDEVIAVRSRNDTIGMLPQLLTEAGLSIGMALMVVATLGMEGAELQVLFGVFAVAALRLMPSVRSILAGWTAIKYNRYTLDILREADLDHADTALHDSTQRMPFRREIEVEGLSFRFDDGERDVLKRLSFRIRKGERIGIRGASGAGKTTLFNLLLGFYRPTRGRILIDGEELTAANRRAWQNTVGYVSQQVFITDSSFAANVALGCSAERIDRPRVTAALRAARLGDFIDTLPRGIDTPIGECGCRLSGGQRQRIGIARALYKQADILFFDEATSALDHDTEESINRSIATLSEENAELTIVVIAHRESSLEYCDRIITIE